MILAAGRGWRLRPFTDTTPKPLLPIGGKPLLQYHLEGLAQAGVRDVVINLCWLGEQIEHWAGDGSRFGLQLHYSRETGTGLDTGGGILRALPLLGDAPFVVLNGDIWTDYPWEKLLAHRLAADRQAHLVMAPNPEGETGDFVFSGGMLQENGGPRLTFTGISLLTPQLFSDASQERFPLRAVLHPAVRRGAVSAECYTGEWRDIGVPQRLQALRARHADTAG